ncbi:DUF2334 domain-containing protein [uncultured Corynebacterium sp.]|uniref:DUF2334 domain-containing protein n=1 Tax=uncultured Corynebacterium sp. TaxID=159447 RepID=UPI0025F33E04|nr:DUF2334 domain-containing protein [uncultured Corynebacterium sp.]
MNPVQSNLSTQRAPRVLLTITGLRRATVTAAERMRDAARALEIHAGLVLTVQGPDWRLKDDRATLELIHDSAARGHELLLGGLGPLGGTSDKGEFHRLGQHEATLRLSAATRQLDALGLAPKVFAPTRWLASEDALQAAAKVGFDVAADAYTIRDLSHDDRYPVRVLAFGDGFGSVKWWRRNVLNSVRRGVTRGRDIRLSISAAKADKDDVADDMLRILELLRESGYQSANYRDYADRQQASVA